MAKVMLVAGRGTSDLRRFLEDRGSVEVSHSYDSLQAHEAELKSGVFYVDKFIYISKPDNETLVRDMQILKELYLTGSYFLPSEILFYTVSPEGTDSTDYCEACMQYLERVSKEDPTIKVPQYNIYSFSTYPSFDKIYSILMGTAEPLDVAPTMDIVYRIERNSESKKSYEAEDTSEDFYEPFSYKRLRDYDLVKRQVIKSDSGQVIIDEPDMGLTKTNPSFGDIYVPDLAKKTTVLFSGNHRSGISTMAVAVSVSILTSLDKVLYVDLTKHKGALDLLLVGNVPFTQVTIKDLLQGSSVSFENGLNIVSLDNEDLFLHFIRLISSEPNRFDVNAIVFDVDREYFKDTHKLLSSLQPKTFLCSGTTKRDLSVVRDLFYTMNTDFDLILSKYYDDLVLSPPDVNTEEIRYQIDTVRRIIAPIVFSNLALDEYLAEKLLEV